MLTHYAGPDYLREFCDGGPLANWDWRLVDCPDCLRSKPEDWLPDIWYAYECVHPECPGQTEGTKTGVVLDLRLPVEAEAPIMRCPLCGQQMEFSESWVAHDSGHGSRGMYPPGGRSV